MQHSYYYIRNGGYEEGCIEQIPAGISANFLGCVHCRLGAQVACVDFSAGVEEVQILPEGRVDGNTLPLRPENKQPVFHDRAKTIRIELAGFGLVGMPGQTVLCLDPVLNAPNICLGVH